MSTTSRLQPSLHGEKLNPPAHWCNPPRFAAIASLLGVFGLSTIWPALLYFWRQWTTDALESLGIVVPVISVLLLARAWRSLGWRVETDWWGLMLLTVTAIAVRVGEQTVVRLNITPDYAILLPPPQLVLIAYGAGFVLLFGGWTLLRAARFPILLLWFATPVPHHFNSLVDLPLQQASATLARAFAVALGQRLTPDQLSLMFTPDFGMFIAPGCNGIRGAVTMGLVALVAGHLFRFRWYATAAFVSAAVVLGYLFNLLRLCVLVLYYLLALHAVPLQNRAEMADYIIGGVLFLVATLLLFAAIHRYRDGLRDIPSQPHSAQDRPISRGPHALSPPLLAMVVFACFGIAGLVQAGTLTGQPVRQHLAVGRQSFPAQLGSFTLQRSWQETDLVGSLIYDWAQYAPSGGGTAVALGIAPAAGWHNPVDCHAARGLRPAWQGQLAMSAADSLPVQFASAFYREDHGSFLEASTLCSGLFCGEVTRSPAHLGITYSRPDPESLLTRTSRPAVPVLLRAATDATADSSESQRRHLTAALRNFVLSANLGALTTAYRR